MSGADFESVAPFGEEDFFREGVSSARRGSTLKDPRLPRRPRLRQSFRSLDEPMFRWWFFSQVLSASGSMTQGVALAWLILRLTHSGVDLGLLTTCTFLPWLVTGPWAGSLVDRVDRRRLLITTQCLFTALSATLALVAWAHAAHVWLLYLLALLTGCVAAPDAAARQVYAVDLVGTDRLTSAISLNEVVINSSRVVGPAAGGALLATLGAGACFTLNAVSFVPPLFVLLVFRRRLPARTTRESRPSGGHFDGIVFAWRNRTIRSALLLAAASGMLFNLNVPLPLLATRVFHLGPGAFGLMMSVFGLGGIVGGLLAAAGHAEPTRRSVSVLAALTGVSVLWCAVAPDLGWEYAGLAAAGCWSIWCIARTNALVQFETSPEMRGRVMGAWAMALPGTEPLSGPLVGWVSESVGPREGFGLSGVALLVIVAVGSGATFRERRDARRSALTGARGAGA